MNFILIWTTLVTATNRKFQNIKNLGDINERIENYIDLKEKLTNYLNTHPIIKVRDFIKKGFKLYDKSSCKFNVENYTFKNIY